MSNSTAADVALLLRRAGFGGTGADVAEAAHRGYEAEVDRLLAMSSPDPGALATPAPPLPLIGFSRPGTPAQGAAQRERSQQTRQLVLWWLERMVRTRNPLKEKVTWFWHGHFATSIVKVREPSLMLRQNELLRSRGAGPFASLTLAAAQDPAMLIWLDAGQDRAGHPNENFARELMELFTLGIGQYTETDVREAARAFTGWTYDRRGDRFVVNAQRHDEGLKTFLGRTGPLDGRAVIDIATRRPESARWVISRLWSRFAAPATPTDPIVTALLPSYGPDRDLTSVLRAMFLHPQFLSAKVRAGLIRQPVEWVVGALRALGIGAADVDVPTLATLRALGQVPFAPPSVGGWPSNEGWLSTASSLAREAFAARAAAKADLSGLADTPAAGRIEATAHLLGVPAWSSPTLQALRSAGGSPALLVTLGLLSPEFVVNGS